MKRLLLCILGGWLAACTPSIPESAGKIEKYPAIYPDYTGLTVPYNIAPLNFRIGEQADAYRTVWYTDQDHRIIVNGKKVDIPLKKWKHLLMEAKGKTLYTDVFVRQQGQWRKYNTITNQVAPDPIDRYLSYRLIEPGYVLYEQMSLNQRDLTDFTEKEIFNNQVLARDGQSHCINCHAYRNYRTSDMQFHVRAYLGGTLIVNDGKAYKVDLKTDSTISAGVYPAWHPTKKCIAYSVNTTYQSFHTRDSQRVEVQDCYSDLILYDLDQNVVTPIVDTPDRLETFPAWSPDGNTLYYACAALPVKAAAKAELIEGLMAHYDEVRYDLMKIPFHQENNTFGSPDTVFAASRRNKSVSLPRVSPDGRYLLFTLGDFGTFHIWHKSSDLCLMELATGEVRELAGLNSDDVESYHSWSSNGRWIVFSSRREDGAYTRPYIAWFSPEGKAGKPFLLPQKDPDHYQQLYKSYNIPEFMVEPVRISFRELKKAIQKEALKANFRKR